MTNFPISAANWDETESETIPANCVCRAVVVDGFVSGH